MIEQGQEFTTDTGDKLRRDKLVVRYYLGSAGYTRAGSYGYRRGWLWGLWPWVEIVTGYVYYCNGKKVSLCLE